MPNLVIKKGDQTSLSKLGKMTESKIPMVCLIHAVWCHHCEIFRPEWDKLKTKKYNTAQIESAEVEEFKKSAIASKILPKDGQMYFPMLIMVVCGRVHHYSGERTAIAIEKFIISITPKKTVSKPAKSTVKSTVKSTIKRIKPSVKSVVKKTKSTVKSSIKRASK